MAHHLTQCLLTAVLLLFAAVATTHAQPLPATVAAAPEVVELAAGSTAQIALTVTDVRDLYGFDLALEFDPAVVEVVDADTALDGTQVGFGTLLDAGFVIRNTADNQLGRVHFVMTQLSPSPSKTGSGTLLVLTLRGKQAGATSPLTPVRARLAGPQGNEILSTAVGGQIRVVANQPPGPTATPIAVQPPGTPLAQAEAELAAATPAPTIEAVGTEVVATEVVGTEAVATEVVATEVAATGTPLATTAPEGSPPAATPPASAAATVARSSADAPEDAPAGPAATGASGPPANAAPASLADAQPTRDDRTAVAGNSVPASVDADTAQTAVQRIGQNVVPPAPAETTSPDGVRSPALPVTPTVMVILAVGALVSLGLFLGRRNQ